MSEINLSTVSKNQAISQTKKWRDGQYQLMGNVLAWSFNVNDIQTLLTQSEDVTYIRLYLINEEENPGKETNLIAVGADSNNIDFLGGELFKAEILCRSNEIGTTCDEGSPLITGGKSSNIDFNVAVEYTTTWRAQPKPSPLTMVGNEVKNIKAWRFDAQSIHQLIQHWQDKKELRYIKFYIATNVTEADETTLVMIGAEPGSIDLIAHETNVFFDFANPCPPLCNDKSDLNHDPEIF